MNRLTNRITRSSEGLKTKLEEKQYLSLHDTD